MCWEMYNLRMHTYKNYGTKKKTLCYQHKWRRTWSPQLIRLLTHNKKTNDNEKTHITKRVKEKQADLISDAQILWINKSIVALETHKTTKTTLEKHKQ
jgi:hypothetical protein